ncbi:hypothetical protein CDAR_585251 [Caerostris darwini]|uniref:Uncharacterized protein n=1 Tax=Caerostris darwini TaxID=1538125 RepID=A0AAV4Q4C1_9ARAC|nr:hypothetical protein CDAR_585251 [Caerostris darwini]
MYIQHRSFTTQGPTEYCLLIQAQKCNNYTLTLISKVGSRDRYPQTGDIAGECDAFPPLADAMRGKRYCPSQKERFFQWNGESFGEIGSREAISIKCKSFAGAYWLNIECETIEECPIEHVGGSFRN